MKNTRSRLFLTIFLIAMVSIGWGVAFLSLAILMQSMAPMQVLAARWAITALLFAVLLEGQYGPGFEAADFIYQGF